MVISQVLIKMNVCYILIINLKLAFHLITLGVVDYKKCKFIKFAKRK